MTIGNYIKKKAINSLRDRISRSSKIGSNLIQMHDIKKMKDGQKDFCVEISYIPESAEEKVIIFLSELLELDQEQVVKSMQNPPMSVININKEDGKHIVKKLRAMKVVAKVKKNL
ncbi:hypothetical protein LAP9571_02869 [Lactiplantibacillus plantarum]|uniref:hypothetical protein n=1 Tax=Lactiplantibacillus plantarum TaxID=1590 RepID=UPI00106D0967|nr:hypothetical protein [Lactiplantibacillus plantarum]VFI63647.1 hypothetical protein LAP9571_02869 [Lactiplantibacillus plantarum]VFI64342.1 hypothetical protein LAP9492_03073 [Lactiplantibacillus plantarum]